ncbi:VRR-NUC domain-containing protein [Chitinimonas sp.]|uniref:VRR-NUC domain-containing protein n=1 Tax=Chitinimonas sp. TaxID=1934313 RepID=UPI002F937A2D
MNRTLDDPHYYLLNFRRVLAWIAERYGDLLIDTEQAFLADFAALPQAAQALLVRMVMRKGELFRASKLRYAEIGDTALAVAPLIELGWVRLDATLNLAQLFGLCTKAELQLALAEPLAERRLSQAGKAEMLAALVDTLNETQPLQAWYPACEDALYWLTVMPVCERFRLMFFGNLHQDWSEFVLADLGIYDYEPVVLAPTARGFQQRADVDTYLQLAEYQRLLAEGETEAALAGVREVPCANPWLEGRRRRLLHRFGQHYERLGELETALVLYQGNDYPGARARCIRVLERLARHEEAHALALQAESAPESEEEAQQVSRMLPRLRRLLGLPPLPRQAALVLEELALCLPQPKDGSTVEFAVRDHLNAEEAPVHYVENGLINSLFGLLCWEAVFAPLPGAFFHPFHRGPADLASPDFVSRRADLFAACLAQLDDGRYLDTIRRHYREKWNRQSPFVFWGLIDETLLEQALTCLPAAHLRLWFQRLLADVSTNRSGLPDLVQFWPTQGRYRLIEVKGPGDRLQDNQLRWLDYCLAHDMPVCVCYVQWVGVA